jgi:hypothetical protein
MKQSISVPHACFSGSLVDFVWIWDVFADFSFCHFRSTLILVFVTLDPLQFKLQFTCSLVFAVVSWFSLHFDCRSDPVHRMCKDCCRRGRHSSWVTGSKDSRFPSPNCTPAVISRTRTLVVRWNTCEDINCSSTRFLSSISHVVLLTSICVYTAVSNPVPRTDSFSIVVWSWLS